MAVSRWIRNSDISFMGQKVIRIAAADKIALAIDLGRKLRIGHSQVESSFPTLQTDLGLCRGSADSRFNQGVVGIMIARI